MVCVMTVYCIISSCSRGNVRIQHLNITGEVKHDTEKATFCESLREAGKCSCAVQQLIAGYTFFYSTSYSKCFWNIDYLPQIWF